MINLYVRSVPRCCYGTSKPSVGISRSSSTSPAPATPTTAPAPPDLPRVIGATHQLAAISCPDLPVKLRQATGVRRRTGLVRSLLSRTGTRFVVTHGHAVADGDLDAVRFGSRVTRFNPRLFRHRLAHS